MPDPITALSLASSIVQLITFTSSLVSKSHEISKSTNGATVEGIELETVATSLRELSADLLPDSIYGRKLGKTEKNLLQLCEGCHDVSEQLLEVIQSLKLRYSNGRWNSFRQALRTVWKEEEIETLSTRLERYRRHIDTTLLASLWESSKRRYKEESQPTTEGSRILLGSVNESTNWQEDIIHRMHLNQWSVQNEQDVAKFSTMLSTGTKGQRDTLIRSRILDRLRFASMKDRLEHIPKAYRRTFDWIFVNKNEAETLKHTSECLDTETEGNSLAEKRSRRTSDSFATWLSSGETLYWITGKPGSGKSTLMKYLFNHPKTTELLSCWTKENPMVTAGFFFWNSGEQMQMSQMGLLRSLLYQVAEKRPDLIPRMFPDRWRTSQLFGDDLHFWSLTELMAAFKTLTSVEITNFVFFIDGLDEFEGEETDLATFILEMTSSPNVKMCVASRPWLGFEDAFERQPSLRLENLTAPDINLFVAGNLSENRMFSKMQRLHSRDAERVITEVTSKAQGVFLWVRLAVVSLLVGLRDGDSIEDLMESLLWLPSDLEELFWKILGSLSASYRRQASYLFQLIRAASTPPSLLTLSFTREDFQSVMEADVEEMPSAEKLFRAETMRRMLNSRCRGLLEAPDFDLQGSEAKVQYLHRTVKDFLNRQDVWKYIISSSQDAYNPDLQLCSAFLFSIKTHLRSNRTLDNFWSKFESCIDYSLRLDPKDHISIIDELEKSANELFETRDAKGATWLQVVLLEERENGRFVMQRIVHWTATALSKGQRSECFMDYARKYPLKSYVDYREDKERREAMQSKNSLQQSTRAGKREPKYKKETTHSPFHQLSRSFRKAFRGIG